MNLAEDYFSEKYIFEEFLAKNFKNKSFEGKIVSFDRVFRRHHVGQDPMSYVDPSGLCPMCFVAGAVFLYSSMTDTQGQGTWEQNKVIDFVVAALGGFSRGGGVVDVSKKYNPNQQALIDIGKQGKRGGFNEGEINILKDWANEYNIPFRGPEVHPGRPFGKDPHFHLGPVDHIKVRCE